MSPEETDELMLLMHRVWPSFEGNATQSEHYHRALSQYDYGTVLSAAQKHMEENEWPPTISQLKYAAGAKQRAEVGKLAATAKPVVGPNLHGRKARNWPPESAVEECAICDDGLVMLKGSVKDMGREYSRGAVPCKWCEAGEARFEFLKQPRPGVRAIEPISNYSLTDVELPTSMIEKLTRERARSRDEYLKKLWLDEGWVRGPDGKMYHSDTGEVCGGALNVPEERLPPLPDGTRPKQKYQQVGLDMNREQRRKAAKAK